MALSGVELALLLLLLLGAVGVILYFVLRPHPAQTITPIPIIPPVTQLTTGETLPQDVKLWESGGNFYAILQSQDGNLVVRTAAGAPLASTGAHPGNAPYRLVSEPSGDVILYDSKNNLRFHTGTAGFVTTPTVLYITPTGSLVLVSPASVIPAWSLN